MSSKNIYEIIGNYLANGSNESDDRILEQWLTESEENKLIFEKLKKNWPGGSLQKSRVIGSDEVKAKIWSHFSKDNPNKAKEIRRFDWAVILKIAATITILLVSFLVVNQMIEKNEIVEVKLATITKENGFGRKSTIFLSDGSVVHLNSDSKLSYPEVFSDTARIIELEGEAFFEVAKDEQRPFVVISSGIGTVAVGTSFNIAAYRDVDEVKISLADGKVKVQSVDNLWLHPYKDQHMLDPGEEISFDLVNNRFSEKRIFNVNRVIGWKSGILIFEKADLNTLIYHLERWYGVEIEVINKHLQNMSYTGEFHNQSLQNVLESIGFVQNFEYEINNKNVVIRFNK